jgi:hypothetical protein
MRLIAQRSGQPRSRAQRSNVGCNRLLGAKCAVYLLPATPSVRLAATFPKHIASGCHPRPRDRPRLFASPPSSAPCEARSTSTGTTEGLSRPLPAASRHRAGIVPSGAHGTREMQGPTISFGASRTLVANATERSTKSPDGRWVPYVDCFVRSDDSYPGIPTASVIC